MDNRPTAVVGNWTHLKAFLSLVSKQSLVLLWSTLRLSHRLQHVRQKCLFQQDGCVFEPDLKPNEVQHTFFLSIMCIFYIMRFFFGGDAWESVRLSSLFPPSAPRPGLTGPKWRVAPPRYWWITAEQFDLVLPLDLTCSPTLISSVGSAGGDEKTWPNQNDLRWAWLNT